MTSMMMTDAILRCDAMRCDAMTGDDPSKAMIVEPAA